MADAPQWFTDAVNAPFRECGVDVDGATVRYLTWGDQDKPGILLAHGGVAHAHWWQYLAPLLAGDYFVAAPHFSGHGDSDWRGRYPMNIWARELAEVRRHAPFSGNPALVGHSMGGIVSVPAAALYGDLFACAVAIDAPIHRPIREPEQGGRSFSHIKPYPSLEKAVSRFRFMPDQPCEHGFIKDFLARTSLRETSAGWIWKFDLHMFERMDVGSIEEYFPRIDIPWAFMRGELSEVAPREAELALNRKFGRAMPFIEIPNARHHLTLDQPLAFVAALRALLEAWGHRQAGSTSQKRA